VSWCKQGIRLIYFWHCKGIDVTLCILILDSVSSYAMFICVLLNCLHSVSSHDIFPSIQNSVPTPLGECPTQTQPVLLCSRFCIGLRATHNKMPWLSCTVPIVKQADCIWVRYFDVVLSIGKSRAAEEVMFCACNMLWLQVTQINPVTNPNHVLTVSDITTGLWQ
jgi:hypothetical protein